MIANKKLSFLAGLKLAGISYLFFTACGIPLLFLSDTGLITSITAVSISSVPSGILFLWWYCKITLHDYRVTFSKTLPVRTYAVLALMAICLIQVSDLVFHYLIIPDWLHDTFNKMAANKWLFFIGAVVIVPVLEELIFRGVILGGMLKKYPAWQAVLYSSVVFSLIHMNPSQSLHAFFLGLLAGWAYLRFKSILAPICIHAINNFVVWLTMTLPELLQKHNFYHLFNSERAIIINGSIAMAVLISCMVVLERNGADRQSAWQETA